MTDLFGGSYGEVEELEEGEWKLHQKAGMFLLEDSLDAKGSSLVRGYRTLGILPQSCQGQSQGFQKPYSFHCPLLFLDWKIVT